MSRQTYPYIEILVQTTAQKEINFLINMNEAKKGIQPTKKNDRITAIRYKMIVSLWTHSPNIFVVDSLVHLFLFIYFVLSIMMHYIGELMKHND